MERIFIINGHQYYPHSQGLLNKTITEHMVKRLSAKYQVKVTYVDQGYLVTEEQDKFIWADCVIYQTPIFWFSIPGKFKQYFDQVLKSGVFYKRQDRYGQGGLLTDKFYMLSTTWSAPEDQFATHGGFFEGRSLDEALFHLHRMQAYIGMRRLKTFALYNVVREPDIKKGLVLLDQHLEEVFDL
ncbi:NAD(P)H-dependent oxidoreductase [Amphibacillus sediminis]|uniref:NAD(P)H-dependent oxidoreductase n=1 Tax=Amphibacillus sediminis TaxID=360185 RepID=UPI0008366949|nr:NAD(P)H-dependent oxidoreductase [Amphibacillus sediminis]